ncbi:3-dehydroquinate synthase [Sporosarcina sp. HYO08]|uniref:3-dehydroquinate synthase n=1 Tax=Sporosarcina sp. HYO08 TaxID=1759557 RepID=UPI000791B0AA|nr:3-dehydroquinate synthase [Sporosarcina sp. HYO08]KXH82019.1 3-dehydroquinate synthase [Sporosarcina sp. HYO08]
MGKLTVGIQNHAYDVHIGSDTYQLLATEYQDLLGSADHIAIIADQQVAEIHLPLLLDALEVTNSEVAVKLVPSGESCKTSAVYLECLSFLLNKGFTRNSLLIAFGGGACGDLTGFVAATFMRGIRYLHCPTTILAHDSAVGGKTAINMPEGKNMVGAFHQPLGVLFQTELFKTLPPVEVRSGMAELLKHAFISDENWTEELLNEPSFTEPSIDWLQVELLKGIQVKAKIVEEDEFEHSSRKFLNFGHTFGHAVEAICGFGGLSHGESVMIGMAYSLLLSESEGGVSAQLTNRFIDFARKNGYTFQPIMDYDFEEFAEYMDKDKKASHGKWHFVLLEKVGQPIVKELTKASCDAAFHQLRERIKKGDGKNDG